MKDTNDNYCCDYCGRRIVINEIAYIDESDSFAVHYNCWFESIKDKVKKSVYEAKAAKNPGPPGTTWPFGPPPVLDEKEPTWKTKDGKVMLISEMTDSHLLAAANKLKTSAVNAIMFKGLDTNVQKYLRHSKYNKLLEEIKKRNLIFEQGGKA